METLLLTLTLPVCFSFLLKQTFRKAWSVAVIALVAAVFTGMSWPYAIEQSSTVINSRMADTGIMLDIAVIMNADVVLQAAFCILAARMGNSGRLSPKTVAAYKVLWWFPGIIIFPILFYTLTYVIFSCPGVSFQLAAWSLAAVVLVFIPAGTLLLKRLLPDSELRLELLFLTNIIIAVAGVVVTVNGRTAVKAAGSVDWGALAGFMVLLAVGMTAGIIAYTIKNRKRK